VFAGAFDGKLYAFPAGGCGAATCRPAWTGATSGHIESTPTVVGGIVYIGSDDGHLYAFKAAGCGTASCRPLWRGSIGGGPVLQSTPAVSSGTVYIGSQHVLAAFRAAGCGAATCAPRWKGTFQNEFLGGSPAVFHSHVYIGLEDGVGVFPAAGCGRPTCSPQQLDVAPGAQAGVDSSPTVAGGLVYAGRNTGEVLAWLAKPCGTFQCTNVFRGATGDPVVSSSPTVVNGKIYIGGADIFGQGRLFVFGPGPTSRGPSQRGAGQAR
jgi:outer membrane protein assembly factor BamB